MASPPDVAGVDTISGVPAAPTAEGPAKRGTAVALPAAVAEQLPGTELTAEDADRLASRGVNAEQAKAAGLRRVGSSCAAHLLGRVEKRDLSGILIPYLAPRELAVAHTRIWLDRPAAVSKSGQAATAEVLQPAGSTNWLYFVPGTTADSLAEIDLPILFCTSEADALAALALDGQPMPLLPVGFGGVWGWRGTTPSIDPATGASKRIHGPVEDLSRISLRGRMVIVCYRSDVNTDAEAFKARKALLGFLRKQGARAAVLEVPPAADGSPRGLGEWIAGDGAAAVAAAIQVTTAAKSSAGRGYQVSEEGIVWNDPNPDKPPQFLASHFEVTACTRELDSTNWGRRLEFHDPDGNPRQLVVPMVDLAGDCTRVAEILLAHGVRVNPNRTAKERLAMYIQRESRERIFVTPASAGITAHSYCRNVLSRRPPRNRWSTRPDSAPPTTTKFKVR